MIIITGAAGFIGSCFIQKLNDEGYNDLVLVDDFSSTEKNKNFEGKRFSKQVHRDEFPEWLRENQLHAQFVFHIGARFGSKRLTLIYHGGIVSVDPVQG